MLRRSLPALQDDGSQKEKYDQKQNCRQTRLLKNAYIALRKRLFQVLCKLKKLI